MDQRKINVGLLFGGRSAEHEVSQASAANVLRALNPDRYNVVLIGITRDGRWLACDAGNGAGTGATKLSIPGDAPQVALVPGGQGRVIPCDGGAAAGMPARLDVVFPVLHGKYGEDGTVQGLLELAGIPYVGCNSLSSAVAMDKVMAHTLVQAEEIKVTSSVVVYRGESATEAAVQAEKLGYPLYVKPVRSGSSIGITKAANKEELIAGIHAAFAHDNKVVIEQNIAGFEIAVNDALTVGMIER